jgi:HK97 family phage major capsid protein
MTPEELVNQIEGKIAEKTSGFASQNEISDLKASLEGLKKDNSNEELKGKMVDLEAAVNALKEAPKKSTGRKSVFDLVMEKASDLKNLIAQKSGVVTLDVKATQVPGDIDSGTDYAQQVGGTYRLPVRQPRITELFRRIPVTTEYVKYREESGVTRDAKVVIACATSKHDTKKTWKVRTVQIAKVRDFVDVCLDMLEDYAFVSAEINQLVTESVELKVEAEILLGSGDINSIDAVSSLFNVANPLADFTAAFVNPTLAELTGAMKAQIYIFGQERNFNADTIVMNYADWVKFMHEKNADGDYLLPNFVSNGSGVLNGMRVITSPIVAPNELYVFDSTKGVILDRQAPVVDIAYENNDNFEHEVATIKAVQRLQFHVATVDEDAFMKCNDIAADLALLCKPYNAVCGEGDGNGEGNGEPNGEG